MLWRSTPGETTISEDSCRERHDDGKSLIGHWDVRDKVERVGWVWNGIKRLSKSDRSWLRGGPV
jgi:hypothetical protein